MPLFQLDAFADRPFAGNPAAVCLPEAPLSDSLMQAIAEENNLSETAFVVREPGGWSIRWFTPACEVELCGHATLAAGALLLERLLPGSDQVVFESRSGPLTVSRAGESFAVVLPERPPVPVAAPAGLAEALGEPVDAYLEADYGLAVLSDEDAVRALDPDLAWIATLPMTGMIVTAAGSDVDFVSRFFAPGVGVPEDPVTGSAHSTLIPYWAERLGRRRLSARQLSRRGGHLQCERLGGEIRLTGRVVAYLEGEITASQAPWPASRPRGPWPC